MDALTLFAAVVRACLFACILVSLGAVGFRWLVLPRSGEAGPYRAIRSAARTGVTAAFLLLPTLATGFGLQLAAFRDPMAPLSDDLALLLSLRWGRVWIAQVALALLLLLSFALVGRGRRIPWLAAALLAIGLAFTPALSGHATSVPELASLAIAVDGLHVTSAGTWLGTLFVLTIVSFRAAPPAPVFLARINAFSPVALGCALVVVVTGTFGAFIHLHSFAELWTTSYGRALSLKLFLFAGVLVLGAYNWRRATPRLRAGADPSQVARSIYAEIATAALVVLVTAWFVATAPPEAAG